VVEFLDTVRDQLLVIMTQGAFCGVAAWANSAVAREELAG
jgi:hypothetical protein